MHGSWGCVPASMGKATEMGKVDFRLEISSELRPVMLLPSRKTASLNVLTTREQSIERLSRNSINRIPSALRSSVAIFTGMTVHSAYTERLLNFRIQ